jgi:hypothetical protein
MTVSYVPGSSGGGGGGGDASAANQTTQIGLETSIRDRLPASLDGSGALKVIQSAPTTVEGAGASYQPGYDRTDQGGGSLQVDPGGNLLTRAQVLTDEGTFRCNFANTSLAVSIGTITLTSGSTAVTWALTDTTDLHKGDYVKLDADAESAWAQVESIESLTSGTLVSVYTGTGGTGAGSRSLLAPTTGSGATISVASGQATIACGTTASAVTRLRRFADYAPLVIRERLSVSQRIANQNIYIGGGEDVAAPRWFARFTVNGTTNTTVICETGRNPTGAPSAAETEQTTVTIPNGGTTASLQDYRLEILTESVRFYIANVLVAEHTKVIPAQHDDITAGISVENGTTPASNTNVVIDYVTTKNHNKIEVGIFSDVERIVAGAVPMAEYAYSTAGVIAINTDLLVIDCLQLRSLYIHCSSMGTTGVVTAQWSNFPDFTGATTATLLSEAGATSTTFNAAVLRAVNVRARYFRLRLTTATTAGTTTIRVVGSQTDVSPIIGTQPVSGTVTATVTGGTVLPVTPTTTFTNSAATNNAAVIKASAGTLWSVVAYNANAAARYVKFYNKATAPTVGTDVPVVVVAIPATSTLKIDGGSNGLRFATGIGIAIVTGAADSDNTAVAANDIKVATTFT